MQERHFLAGSRSSRKTLSCRFPNPMKDSYRFLQNLTDSYRILQPLTESYRLLQPLSGGVLLETFSLFFILFVYLVTGFSPRISLPSVAYAAMQVYDTAECVQNRLYSH